LIVSVERLLEQLLFAGKSKLINYLFHNCGLWQTCSCASSKERLKRGSFVDNLSRVLVFLLHPKSSTLSVSSVWYPLMTRKSCWGKKSPVSDL